MRLHILYWNSVFDCTTHIRTICLWDEKPPSTHSHTISCLNKQVNTSLLALQCTVPPRATHTYTFSYTHLHILLHTLTYSRLMWPIGGAYLPHWVSGYVIVLCKYVPAYLPVLRESKEGLCSLCTGGCLQESLQYYGMWHSSSNGNSDVVKAYYHAWVDWMGD